MITRFITNEQHYKEVIVPVASAKQFVWIGTADIKDLHVKHKGMTVSFLHVLNDLIKRGVSVRLLHAKDGGVNFRNSFDKYPLLWERMERTLCPRVHVKHIVIDGVFGPELIKKLSHEWKIPINFMFIASPGDHFLYKVEELGGVRLII